VAGGQHLKELWGLGLEEDALFDVLALFQGAQAPFITLRGRSLGSMGQLLGPEWELFK
jgi:hypothetical protein